MKFICRNDCGVVRILLVCVFLLLSQNALAMKCVNANNGQTVFTDTLAQAAVPSSAPDGTLVWRSATQNLTIQCWEDWGGAYSQTQPVYVYINPADATIGAGIVLGMVLNGHEFPDVSNMNDKWKIPGVTVPKCSNSDSNYCKANYSTTFTLSYYITVKTNNSPPSGHYTGNNTFDFFQLDGSNGLNTTMNYRYRLTGLQNIRFIGCSAEVNVQPSVIDFGSIPIPSSVTADTLIKSKNFNINVSRSCNDPFALTALFTSTSTVENDKVKFNDMYLKLYDLTRNAFIDFSNLNDLIDFADLTDVLEVNLPFRADLYWQGTTPTAGDYTPAITVTVFYN
ncbi:TPA: fimbrial protein [Enterobacter ludwigii]